MLDDAVMGQWLGAVAGRQPLVGLAAVLVDRDRVEVSTFGLADVPSGRPVADDTVFRIASITKTFTAIGIMQLHEEGLLDLDAPAVQYLSSFRLVPARPGLSQPTVRHLLTHTAGLPELAHAGGILRPDFGESVPAGDPLPSLAQFYGGALPVCAEPGSRFVYGNQSPATLGQIIADVTRTPLDRYFAERIFEPLGMDHSALGRSPLLAAGLATGYEIGHRGPRRIPERDMITAGAASVLSTPRDMGRYLQALLNGGRGERGRILRPDTLQLMSAPQYQPDPRVPGMGLGFFRTVTRGRPTIGHQGTLPGFHSYLLAAPEAGVGVLGMTNGARQADFWLPGEVTSLLAQQLGGEPPASQPAPQRPDLWADLCGWYRLSARATDVRLRGLMGAGIEVFVRSGALHLRFLTPIPALARGFALIPDDPVDPYAQRVELPAGGPGPLRIVFSLDRHGHADALHFVDLMPLRLDKQPQRTNPRRWALATGSAVAVGAGAAASRGPWRRRT